MVKQYILSSQNITAVSIETTNRTGIGVGQVQSGYIGRRIRVELGAEVRQAAECAFTGIGQRLIQGRPAVLFQVTHDVFDALAARRLDFVMHVANGGIAAGIAC